MATVLLSAVLAGACGDEYEKGAGVYTATPTGTAAAVSTVDAAAGADQSQRADRAGAQEASESAALSAPQRAAVEGASAAARAFLADYLLYSYGRADARELRAVVPELRAELARHPPRVPPAKREQARPRLRGLQLSGVDTGRVILLAQVDDRDSRYAALVTVSRRGGSWLVSEVR